MDANKRIIRTIKFEHLKSLTIMIILIFFNENKYLHIIIIMHNIGFKSPHSIYVLGISMAKRFFYIIYTKLLFCILKFEKIGSFFTILNL